MIIWTEVKPDPKGTTQFAPFWSIRGKDCQITLEPWPGYCDRGNWIAKIFPAPSSKLSLELDASDMWPRYYFNLDRAKAEVLDWLKKRKQEAP